MRFRKNVKTVQVGRTGFGNYELGEVGADWYSDSGFRTSRRTGKSFITVFCPEEFHKYTNLHLRPGEGPKLMQITFTEVQE